VKLRTSVFRGQLHTSFAAKSAAQDDTIVRVRIH
jgi:hypothetical protein